MHPEGYFFIAGLLLSASALCWSVSRLRDVDNPRRALETTYATVPAHIAEFAFWTVRNGIAAATGARPRRGWLVDALPALLCLLAVGMVPLVAVAKAGSPALTRHAFAVGVGGLIWTSVLETATLRERANKLAGREVLRLPLLEWALLLTAFDFVVVACRFLHPGIDADTTLIAGAVGVAYVAIADLVSCYIGVVLSPWHPYLLSGR